MTNLIAFINEFLEYLVVFGTAVVLVLIGVFAGMKMRKRKDAQSSTS
ncbi:MAG: hypothetical protein GX234_08845 [Clostridiales bacterium]|nr:hypothetical protein [Clostridiales bacterium]